jgi:hypothetical protein
MHAARSRARAPSRAASYSRRPAVAVLMLVAVVRCCHASLKTAPQPPLRRSRGPQTGSRRLAPGARMADAGAGQATVRFGVATRSASGPAGAPEDGPACAPRTGPHATALLLAPVSASVVSSPFVLVKSPCSFTGTTVTGRRIFCIDPQPFFPGGNNPSHTSFIEATTMRSESGSPLINAER